jgi:hypothetical protein
MWASKGFMIDTGHLGSDDPVTFQPAYVGGRYVGLSTEHGLSPGNFPISVTCDNVPADLDAGVMDVYIQIARGWEANFIDRRG